MALEVKLLPYSNVSVTILTTPIVCCHERERLTQMYLDVTENRRKASDSIKDIHSPEWLRAIEEPRALCEAILATLRAHREDHGC
jgi:hypothetical protein